MGKKYNDLTDKVISNIKILKRSDQKDPKNIIWVGECLHCGSIKNYRGSDLKSGTRISCGCIGNLSGSGSPYWCGCGELSLNYYNKIKQTASRRKIEFTVTIEYLWDLFITQNKKCKYTKVELQMPKTSDSLKHGGKTASLDRINSNNGYVIGNVQWVHKDINMMKQKYNNDYFIQLCILVVEGVK